MSKQFANRLLNDRKLLQAIAAKLEMHPMTLRAVAQAAQ